MPTTSIALEEQAGILTLVNPTPRGGPGETRPKPLRRARVLKVPHYQLDDNVLAEEVQNVREFGPQMQPRSVETYQPHGNVHCPARRHDRVQRVGAASPPLMSISNPAC